jgi:hypothetical protein
MVNLITAVFRLTVRQLEMNPMGRGLRAQEKEILLWVKDQSDKIKRHADELERAVLSDPDNKRLQMFLGLTRRELYWGVHRPTWAFSRSEWGPSPIRAKTCGSVLCAMLRGRLA